MIGTRCNCGIAQCLRQGYAIIAEQRRITVRRWKTFRCGLFGRMWRVLNHRSVIFRQINKDNPRTHHDALEFPDGQTVLLTDVFEGQEATVLQFPVQAVTAADLKVQERVFYAG